MATVAPLDRSLASNVFTAYLPTSVGFVQRLREFIPGLSRALQPRSPVAAPTRPGNMLPLDAPAASGSVLGLVRPARSTRPLQQLPLAMHDEIRGRFQAINTASNPTNWYQRGNGDFTFGEHSWSDAFRATVQTDDGQRLPVLPEALLHSSLLNAGLDGQLAWRAKGYTLDDINSRIGEIREEIAAGDARVERPFVYWLLPRAVRSMIPCDSSLQKITMAVFLPKVCNKLRSQGGQCHFKTSPIGVGVNWTALGVDDRHGGVVAGNESHTVACLLAKGIGVQATALMGEG